MVMLMDWKKVRIQGHAGAALKMDSFGPVTAADVHINQCNRILNSMYDRFLGLYL